MQEHWLCSLSIKDELQLLKLKKLEVHEPAIIMTLTAAAEQLSRSLQNDEPKLGQLVVVRFMEAMPPRIVAVEMTEPNRRSNPMFSGTTLGDGVVQV